MMNMPLLKELKSGENGLEGVTETGETVALKAPWWGDICHVIQNRGSTKEKERNRNVIEEVKKLGRSSPDKYILLGSYQTGHPDDSETNLAVLTYLYLKPRQ